MTHDSSNQVRTRQRAAGGALVFCLAALVAFAAPPLPPAPTGLAISSGISDPTNALAPLPVALPALVTNRLAWHPFTNTCLWRGGSTNTLWRTNGAAVEEIISTTNRYTLFASLSNYILRSGTNVLATTTGTSALVSFPRQSQPDYELWARLTTGQLLGIGHLGWPAATNLGQLFVKVEGSTNLVNWTKRETFFAFIPLTNRHENFRAVIALEPLTTNAALVYVPNLIVVTNL
jgi:hypothetical protein